MRIIRRPYFMLQDIIQFGGVRQGKMCVFENYDRRRGHGLKLRAVRPHTDFGRHSYGYRTVALWNVESAFT